MFLHCHLTFTASNKKSVNNTYPFVLLYIMCQISLAALKIFLFVCLPLNFSIYIVMFSENDFITLFGVCLAFWISGFIVYNKFVKNFIYLFLIFFWHSPYSESPNTHILYIFILSHMPLSFHSYFSALLLSLVQFR